MEKDKINPSEIKELIPHREPFLYIEKLSNIQKLDRVQHKHLLMKMFF